MGVVNNDILAGQKRIFRNKYAIRVCKKPKCPEGHFVNLIEKPPLGT